MKKIISLLIAGAITFSHIPFSSAHSNYKFYDVQEADSTYIPIRFLAENNIINGYPDGSFRPAQPVKRAEAVKMLMTSLNSEKNWNTATYVKKRFSDMDTDAWYAPYVDAAASDGIISGYEDGSFHPEAPITKAEALKMMFKTYDIEHTSTSKCTKWYANFVKEAKSQGWILPEPGGKRIYPNREITRGEFSSVMYQIMSASKNKVISVHHLPYNTQIILDTTGWSSGDMIDTWNWNTNENMEKKILISYE